MQDSPIVFLKRIVGIALILAVLLTLVLYFSGPKTLSDSSKTPEQAGYAIGDSIGDTPENTTLPLSDSADSATSVSLPPAKTVSATSKPKTSTSLSASDLLIRKAEQLPPSVVAIIYYDTDGFHPANFRVWAGTSVRFINRSNTSMRVSSVLQSGALVYPAFDQVYSVGRGGHYDFNFSQRGAWSFSNANLKQHYGSVVVE